MKTNPVVHFEIPAENTKRVMEFYSKVFGWKCEQMGKEYGEYIIAMTSDSDKNGPKEKGRINGGIFQRSGQSPITGPSFVITVDDINEHVKKVKEGGGKILTKPMEIPNVGILAVFEDTEGNRLSIMQPKMNMKKK